MASGSSALAGAHRIMGKTLNNQQNNIVNTLQFSLDVNSSSSSEASSPPLLHSDVISNDSLHCDFNHSQNNDNSLKCLYTNAQSLINKQFELQAIVDIYDSDITGITETWLNSEILDNEYCIEGYHNSINLFVKTESTQRMTEEEESYCL